MVRDTMSLMTITDSLATTTMLVSTMASALYHANDRKTLCAGAAPELVVGALRFRSLTRIGDLGLP